MHDALDRQAKPGERIVDRFPMCWEPAPSSLPACPPYLTVKYKKETKTAPRPGVFRRLDMRLLMWLSLLSGCSLLVESQRRAQCVKGRRFAFHFGGQSLLQEAAYAFPSGLGPDGLW